MLEVTQQGREAMAKTIAAQRGEGTRPAPEYPGGPFVPAHGDVLTVVAADRIAYGHGAGRSRVPAAAGHSGVVLDQQPRDVCAQVTHTLPIVAANPANATSADARMGPPSVTVAVIDNRGPAAVGAVLPPGAFTVPRLAPHTAPGHAATAIGGRP